MTASRETLLALAAVLALAGCSGPISRTSLSFPLADSHRPTVALARPDANWEAPEAKAYLAKLADKVDDEWYWRVAQQSRKETLPASGTVVVVTCVLTSDGRVKDATATGARNDLAHQLCLEALQANQPYGHWTGAMTAALGQEQRLTLRFHYVWVSSDFTNFLNTQIASGSSNIMVRR